ncbi:M14 family metallopeptidase [Pedobacter sp. ASV28]|uniref:M14 family metallopeptidase n=1 Tax=Pedobacter sp. ASV28 TaxID=2795123 RepID=UPI0018ED68B4|nr:M14 family metallopeptidase [Pedobacter sp. ASV28]
MKKYVLMAAMILCAIITKSQKPENILAAVGTPPSPKVSISWNRYNDYAAITEICKKLAAAHPSLVKLEVIGKSYKGKDLWVMTISDSKKGNPDQKPAMYIDGNIHSNEIQGSEFALYTAWYLAEMHAAGNKSIQSLLADKTFYIVPTINPDARDHFIHQANTAHSPRTGLIPIDNDRDGLDNEDGFDDLDGDGHITMMRRKNPNGRYKVDPSDYRRMIMVGYDEKGEYELLGSEGIDNDGDGLVNEDGEGAYDPNRDWGWNWQPNYIQGGAYKYPFSIPENRAVVDFVMKHPNIAAAQSYHNNGGMILRGPGAAEDVDTYNPQDIRVYDALGKKGEELLPGYRYLVVYKDLYSVFGGELDWFYGGRGIYTFSNELWTAYAMYNKSGAESTQDQLYSFDKDLLMKDAFVDWKPFKHPQYGDIEIGGFKKNYTRLHPGFLLESDAHRNMAFSVFHAYHTPKLSVDEIEVKDIGGGLKQVTAVVSNERMIPTHSSQDIKNNIEIPDIVSLTGGTVVAGMVVNNRDLGISTEQKLDPANIRVANIAGNSYVTVRWLVKGGSKFTVNVNSKKGGLTSRSN